MCYHYYYCTKVMIQEQTISFDKLVAALKEMNDKIGSLSYYLFALYCCPLNMKSQFESIVVQ